MSAQRKPGPYCQLEKPLCIDDGTMSRSEGAYAEPVGLFNASGDASKIKHTLKVLGFDGSKVHDFLFHVAFSEIQWQDLISDPTADVNSLVQKHRALDRASALYDMFLDACTQGPQQSIDFLAKQHSLQKKYLLESQVILRAAQEQNTRTQAMLSEIAFGAQVVKSTATAGVAIIGLFLAGPEIVGAGIALGFDIAMEAVNHLGPSNESNADTVVVGFKQTVANDVTGIAGSVQQSSLESTKDVLEKTLSYPLKSSVYRSAAATGAQLDSLLKTLGWFSLGVTLYTEWNASKSSWDQMQSARSALQH